MQYWWSYKINFRCRLGLDVNTEDAFDNILQSPKYKQNMSDSKFVKNRQNQPPEVFYKNSCP